MTKHSNRIHPYSDYNPYKMAAKKQRLINIGKWCKFALGFPMTYIILPLSCCIRNPAADEIFDKDENTFKPFENVVVGCASAISCVSCFHCCLGCCGKYSPKETWAMYE